MLRRTTALAATLLFALSSGTALAAWKSPEAKSLFEVKDFPENKAADQSKTNPGNLDMYLHVPADMPENAPLVIALHGCTQNAKIYNKQSGWTAQADKHKFYMLFPQQEITSDGNAKKLGNPFGCFNWAGYYGARWKANEGEVKSIIDMVDYMKNNANYSIDPKQVFIAGFSAGGSFVMNALVGHPDVFNAGAAMNAVAARCANTVDSAFACMGLDPDAYFGPRTGSGCESGEACMDPKLKKTAEAWLPVLKEYGPAGYAGAYPRLISWQGDEDALVDDDNQQEIVKQWTALHDIPATGEQGKIKESHEKHVATFYKKGDQVMLTTVLLKDMPHGIIIDEGDGEDQGGDEDTDPYSGGYAFDEGMHSTYYTLKFWGLIK